MFATVVFTTDFNQPLMARLLVGVLVGTLLSARFAMLYLRSHRYAIKQKGRWLAAMAVLGVGLLIYLMRHL
jgi:hypothetical protein